MEDGEATEGDPLPKASTKRKPPKIEENRSKKEHVNVVFIGHVGKSRISRSLLRSVNEISYFKMPANRLSEDKSCH